MAALKLFGHYISQPSRAVIWVLNMKGIPFEFVKVDPTQGGKHRTAEFMQVSPGGTIPAIQDGDLNLGESHAILTYLCDKHGWADLYPTDLKQRARVDEYLHWHHANMRLCTTRLFAPRMLQVVMGRDPTPEAVAAAHKAVGKVLESFDKRFLGRPATAATSASSSSSSSSTSKFVAGNSVTLADIAAYCELDQVEYAKLFDLTPYSRVQQWMGEMKKLPEHDPIRRSLVKLSEMIVQKTAAKL